MRLTSIHRFPVKSCRGESVAAAAVEPWGLAGDRRWMLVDPDGAAVTARQANGLVLVHPELTDDGLLLRAPGRTPLAVATPDPATQVPVALWSSRITGAPAGDEADAWFAEVIGRPLRLIHLDDPARRTTDPEFSAPEDRVSFADGYPLLVATEESLAALNDAIGGDGVPMDRFRPNLVVAGAEAWAEDDWRTVRVGDAVFRAVKGCARCVLTTIDPDTAARGPEPIRTLARIRRFDGQTWFGVNLIPDTPGAVVRVGDEVEVLDSVAPGQGPVRPPR